MGEVTDWHLGDILQLFRWGEPAGSAWAEALASYGFVDGDLLSQRLLRWQRAVDGRSILFVLFRACSIEMWMHSSIEPYRPPESHREIYLLVVVVVALGRRGGRLWIRFSTFWIFKFLIFGSKFLAGGTISGGSHLAYVCPGFSLYLLSRK